MYFFYLNSNLFLMKLFFWNKEDKYLDDIFFRDFYIEPAIFTKLLDARKGEGVLLRAKEVLLRAKRVSVWAKKMLYERVSFRGGGWLE